MIEITPNNSSLQVLFNKTLSQAYIGVCRVGTSVLLSTGDETYELKTNNKVHIIGALEDLVGSPIRIVNASKEEFYTFVSIATDYGYVHVRLDDREVAQEPIVLEDKPSFKAGLNQRYLAIKCFFYDLKRMFNE